MEIAFTVKNTSRALRPSKDDVLIYDGKMWYVTTKQDLFSEYDKELAKLIQEKEQMRIELNDFKAEMARQMLEYGQLIREVITNKGEQQ